MTWVKIDDNLPDNPKVAGVSVPARWAYVSAICYASRTLSDGYVPRTKLDALDGNAKVAVELVAAGLWEPVDGGWLIHDYLRHNRSREMVKAVREQASEAGRISVARRQRSVQRTAEQNVEQNVERSDEQAVERIVERLAERNVLSGSASAATPSLDRSGDQQLQNQKNEPLNVPLNEPLPNDDLRQSLDLWTHCTGQLVTSHIAERIEAAVAKFTVGWVLDAIRETGDNHAKSWSYTLRILERWEREGRETRSAPSRNGASGSKSDPTWDYEAELRKATERTRRETESRARP